MHVKHAAVSNLLLSFKHAMHLKTLFMHLWKMMKRARKAWRYTSAVCSTAGTAETTYLYFAWSTFYGPSIVQSNIMFVWLMCILMNVFQFILITHSCSSSLLLHIVRFTWIAQCTFVSLHPHTGDSRFLVRQPCLARNIRPSGSDSSFRYCHF